MNRVITQKRVALWLGLVVMNVMGCANRQDATCPLPQDGVCAPIHVVDATWKARDAKGDRALLHNTTHDTDKGEA